MSEGSDKGRLVPFGRAREVGQVKVRRTWPRLTGVALMVTLLVSCGSESRRSEATPGFDGSAKPLDTAPFSPAEPRKPSSATTIPGSFFGAGSEPSNSATPFTITPGPPPTAVGPLVEPDPSTVTTLCGFEATVAPFQHLPGETPARTEILISELVDVTARYVEVAPPGVKPDLEAIRVELARIKDILAANGWNPRSPAFSDLLTQLDATAPNPDSLVARIARVASAEAASCR